MARYLFLAQQVHHLLPLHLLMTPETPLFLLLQTPLLLQALFICKSCLTSTPPAIGQSASLFNQLRNDIYSHSIKKYSTVKPVSPFSGVFF